MIIRKFTVNSERFSSGTGSGIAQTQIGVGALPDLPCARRTAKKKTQIFICQVHNGKIKAKNMKRMLPGFSLKRRALPGFQPETGGIARVSA